MASSERLFNRDAVKALFIAVIATVAGLLVLAWQYNRLAEQRLPQLEQELAQQRQALEQQKATAALRSFLDARIGGDEARAKQYITERAMEQSDQGEFQLTGGYSAYTILQAEQTGEHEFRFHVEIEREAQSFPQAEVIAVEKILEQYYVDSVQIAG